LLGIIRTTLALAVSTLLVSCATQHNETLRSPSGRFEVSYSEGNQELDASYGVTDSRNKIHYSFSSGADTPIGRSKFFWSATEMTVVVLQESAERRVHDRFLLVRLGGEGESEFWLLKRKPLEIRYFDGTPAMVDSVGDVDVTFRLGDGQVKRIGLNELGSESRRQERALD